MIDAKNIKHTLTSPDGKYTLVFVCPEANTSKASQTSFCFVQQGDTSIYLGKQHSASAAWASEGNALVLPVLNSDGQQCLAYANLDSMELRASREHFPDLHIQSLHNDYVQFVSSPAEDALYDNMDIHDIPWHWSRTLESFTWSESGFADSHLFSVLEAAAERSKLYFEVAQPKESSNNGRKNEASQQAGSKWTSWGAKSFGFGRTPDGFDPSSRQDYSSHTYYKQAFGKQLEGRNSCISCLLLLVLFPAIIIFFIVSFLFSQLFLLAHTIINSLSSNKLDPFTLRMRSAQQANMCVMLILFIVTLPLLPIVWLIRYLTQPSRRS